jgi:hypothetical protein
MKTAQGVAFWIGCFLSFISASAATNDLVITSITKQEDCVTLQWRSHPAEYYTVYWTDRLELPIFWRVAEVNLPSGGTNTVWTEGSCSESMMAGTGFGQRKLHSVGGAKGGAQGKVHGLRGARLSLSAGPSQSTEDGQQAGDEFHSCHRGWRFRWGDGAVERAGHS